MSKKILQNSILTLLAVFAVIGIESLTHSRPLPVTITPVVEAAPTPKLTHQQEVWLYTLEWCESKGVETAINPKDRDNTPSYYSFQFKPGTFKSFGEKYAIIETGHSDAEIMALMKNYDLQRSIVEHMIFDKSVNWKMQFPDCVKKYGLPPKSN